jgi:lysophospholipase L1-like esterase
MHSDNRLVWVLAFLLLALLLSALANVYFLKLGRHFFRELSLARLDPLGIAQIDTTDDGRLAVAPEKQVVFVGDSRAAAWPAPDTLPGFVFINRGVNGHTAVQTHQRFDQHVTPLQPDIVVIQVGINDLHAIAVLADDKAAIIRTCQESLLALVTQSRAAGATVILTTIIPAEAPTLADRLTWSAEVETAVHTVNNFIRAQQTDGVIVLDAHALLADQNGRLASHYAADFLHVNEQGYTILNEALVQLLQQMQ